MHSFQLPLCGFWVTGKVPQCKQVICGSWRKMLLADASSTSLKFQLNPSFIHSWVGWWGVGLVSVKTWCNLLTPTKGELYSLNMLVLLYKRFSVFHSPVIWEGICCFCCCGKGKLRVLQRKVEHATQTKGLHWLILRLHSGITRTFQSQEYWTHPGGNKSPTDLTGGCRVEGCSWL